MATNPERSFDEKAQHAPLAPALFAWICRTLYEASGIVMASGKETMVRARLLPRLKALGLTSFEEYVALIEQDPEGVEFKQMLNVLTTNKTSFFREDSHFDFLEQLCATAWKTKTRLRIWCAGCSSGEEPYSVAMLLHRAWPSWKSRDLRILATDLSSRVLQDAKQARFAAGQEAEIPVKWRDLFRQSVFPDTGPAHVRIAPDIASVVTFARLNLMGPWPMKGPFDLIFCRNVMIYFDKKTQYHLAGRFAELLGVGCHLLIGHSESLTQSGVPLQYVLPAVYQK